MIRRWPNRSNGAAAAASIPFFVVVVGRRFVLSASVRRRTSVLPKIEHVDGRTADAGRTFFTGAAVQTSAWVLVDMCGPTGGEEGSFREHA